MYELDWNDIYAFVKDNMAILEQNFEFMRTGWNMSLGMLFFVHSTPPPVAMELRKSS
jgi:hypothetical protein